ncbi:SDR family NAD(P)-dependent oxidoreductase [Candidatus Halobonum tyrrellensis]|uniref:Short-chain dehydrogenase/reductase SDR n=1 Tax=Candidatus Halobonum tyrrellensis G22 TaxID=1324957 RepID=V4HAD6_9EURY|nr:SDR family oxidoreductase [Candidatus Halobonum tyrrellensis]ESP87013.1 short-chain dehydrogenase/reductase SDR [Candidatus Halobonum tyrrellensis G22]
MTAGSATYEFTDRVAVVTGGSSGIGRAVARRFGEAGAHVVVADVRERPRDADRPTHEAIRDAGGSADYVDCDVSDPAEVESVVEAAREYGGVDVMVNNAGVYRHAPLVEAGVDAFDRLYAVNVRGAFAGCRAAARDMLDRGEPGCIVNTASISSRYAQVGHAAYDASKGAIAMLTRVAALELAGSEIRVNAVAPGRVDTRLGDGDDADASAPESVEGWDAPEFTKDVPMGRAADPEEVAGSYLFLACEDASYVTGHLLYVDGGYAVL